MMGPYVSHVDATQRSLERSVSCEREALGDEMAELLRQADGFIRARLAYSLNSAQVCARIADVLRRWEEGR